MAKEPGAVTTEEPAEDAVPTGLFRKMVWVRERIDRVPRTGWNEFHEYRYATESDLVDGIRPLLDEAGLVVLMDAAGPLLDEERKTRNRSTFITTVPLKFTIVDADSGEKYESTVYGRGEDPLDKGPYKAYTGALKYFLMKCFQIPTGDEPEQPTAADEDSVRGGATRAEEPAPETRPAAAKSSERKPSRAQQARALEQARADILKSADELRDYVNDEQIGDQDDAETLDIAVAIAKDVAAPEAHIKEAVVRVRDLVAKYLNATREPGEEG